MTQQIVSKERVKYFAEVFTPLNIVNAMLDLVSDECKRVDSCFLEPACGKGIFLVEILRRKLKTLTQEYADNPKKYEEFLILAIASIYGVDILTDNVFDSRNALLDLLTTQYQTVFNNSLCDKIVRKILEILENNIIKGDFLKLSAPLLSNENNIFFKRQFDVVIGNPPYHINDGGAGASAKPLYHLFVNKAKELMPKYITMIIPARWYVGGKGLDKFRYEMLHDTRIRILEDFPDASACFSGVEIKGGVCYFRWDRDNKGKCNIRNNDKKCKSIRTRYLLENNADTFIRFNNAVSIFQTVRNQNEDTFEKIVSSRKPFGFTSDFNNFSNIPFRDSCKIYANKSVGYIKREKITRGVELLDKYKVCISRAYGAGEGFPHQIINKPFLCEPNSCCTETYLCIGPFKNQKIAENVISYMKTKFFRFLVMLHKITQDATQTVYQFVPLQDFNEPWTDEKLYKKYELSDDEIQFIESMIKPME